MSDRPPSPDLSTWTELAECVKQGKVTALIDSLDVDTLIHCLDDLDKQADAVRVLLRAARARDRYRPASRNGGTA